MPTFMGELTRTAARRIRGNRRNCRRGDPESRRLSSRDFHEVAWRFFLQTIIFSRLGFQFRPMFTLVSWLKCCNYNKSKYPLYTHRGFLVLYSRNAGKAEASTTQHYDEKQYRTI